ncbi:hypothetical protein EUA93_19385 [Nocardioides oleivorans]|uniref:Ig-like domain repeat protein n=1 Tax=Nocardioides oleivorans TaxID=273676 RepID=A0A4Q2RQ59_9ACTN|nr:Ig-like domain repeat protein [Nocardioides oleivorans]RYB91091.1 hypothetical protein EUA93_19385 [Nocardioides oleivorans]
MSALSRSLVAVSLAAALTVAGARATPASADGPTGARPSARVATSTTSVVLSTTRSAYGQTVTATAAVATSTGRADGDVYVSVDGVASKVNLSATGSATVVLPDAPVGDHAVTATFVPQFPVDQQGSTSPAQAWTVGQVRTRLFVDVQGRGLRIPTVVRVEAGGEYGSTPTGRVTITLERIGTGRTTVRTKVLPREGVVEARYGRLPRGGYRSVVTYAGDAEHLPEKRVQRFRVRQR